MDCIVVINTATRAQTRRFYGTTNQVKLSHCIWFRSIEGICRNLISHCLYKTKNESALTSDLARRKIERKTRILIDRSLDQAGTFLYIHTATKQTSSLQKMKTICGKSQRIFTYCDQYISVRMTTYSREEI